MIDPVTGAALGEALGAITGQMAGQSLADAYNQRMTDTYTDASGIEIGVGNYTDNKPSISGNTSNTVVDSQESDPSVAFENYETAGGVVDSTTGGFIYGSNVGTYNYCLLETEDQEVKAVAPVSVPVETAYVAIAQALGLSMKVSEVDPVLADKFARGIIAAGCVYDKAKGLVTAWWDGVHILFPKTAIDVVNEVIEDEIQISTELIVDTSAVDLEGLPETGPIAISPPASYVGNGKYSLEYTLNGNVEGVYTVPVGVVSNPGASKYDGALFAYGSYGSSVHLTSDNPNINNTTLEILAPYTHNGVTVYYNYTWAGQFDYQGVPNTISPSLGVYAWILSNGATVANGYPDGISESKAHSYTPSTIPSAGGVATSPTTTVPVVPINLPENPTDTTGSTVDPISATDEDTVSDLPAQPIPIPIPDTNVSNPDVPLVDSSVVNSTLINELVEELANTLDPQPEQSSGIIPFPFMPGTPVDPDDPSQGSSYPSIVPASGSGLIHVYNPTSGEFVGFGNWLWVTYADATIDKIWNNPFDGIIGAHELYTTPQTDGRDNIRSGFLVCPVQSDLVRQRYTEIDCGTVIVPEFYGNYFDYSPYSQAYIYLPFIGINEVSIDDIVGHAVNIRYRVDAYNGSCIAMIYVAKSGYRNLCYQFAGNCAVEVPLAGGSQAAIKAGMLQAEAYSRAAIQSAQIQKTASIGSGILGGAAGSSFAGPLAGIIGALAGGTSGYIQGSANVAAAKLQGQAMQEAARYANKSSVQHSGQFGASHGAMGLKTPFIMIRNPIQVKVVNYNDDYGFPAHKRVIIGGCTGYLRVREVNVISAHATNEEKRAIEEELKAGVYVS